MNLVVILGAVSVVGAIGALWWGLTARPSAARANLFAALPAESTPERKSAAIIQKLGEKTRRIVPNALADGLEVRLVQAGYPNGIDLPRLLGIKFALAGLAALLLVLVGQPVFALVAAE